METKVFLDTNILFDMIDVSRPNSQNVKKLFLVSAEKNLSFFISAITINNIVYVMQNRFKMSADDLKDKLKKLYRIIEIVPYDMEVITDGLKLEFSDIEDSFQFISALKSKSDFLITEDKKFLQKNLKNKMLRVMNTHDFLQEIL